MRSWPVSAFCGPTFSFWNADVFWRTGCFTSIDIKTLIPDDNDVGLFSAAVFKEAIIPLIVRLFAVHDVTIRKVLLAHFEHYVHLFEKDQLAFYIVSMPLDYTRYLEGRVTPPRK